MSDIRYLDLELFHLRPVVLHLARYLIFLRLIAAHLGL